MAEYNIYQKEEKYVNGVPQGEYRKGSLIGTAEYASKEECEKGGATPPVYNPCGIENVITYESTDGKLKYKLNNASSYSTSTGGTLDLGKDTVVTRIIFDNYYKGNENLTKMDLARLCTANVTDMSDMFLECYYLQSLDLSSFDTSNVTDMSSMFNNCRSLTSLDLSSFNTSKVADMSFMFFNCSFTSLDLSGWDTSNVTNMNSLFNYCSSLTSLDLSSFNTSKVTRMGVMFGDCTSLNHIKCKQAFKDWCQANKSSISLDNFDTINWEIVG